MIGFIGGSGFENFLDEKTVKLFDTVTKWGTPSQALRKFLLMDANLCLCNDTAEAKSYHIKSTTKQILVHFMN